MGWVRVDDAFYDHPKFLRAGMCATGAWLCLVAWSNRNRKDGKIPDAIPPRLGISPDDMQTLEECELAHRNDDGWELHDYLDYQPSSDEIAARAEVIKAKRAEAGRRGAEARWQNGKPDGNGDSKPMASEWQEDGPNPNPNPNPIEREPRKRGALPTESFVITEALAAWAQEHCPWADLERERLAWIDWATANHRTYKDLPAGFRTWLRRVKAPTTVKPSAYGAPTRALLGRGVNAEPLYEINEDGFAVPKGKL